MKLYGGARRIGENEIVAELMLENIFRAVRLVENESARFFQHDKSGIFRAVFTDQWFEGGRRVRRLLWQRGWRRGLRVSSRSG